MAGMTDNTKHMKLNHMTAACQQVMQKAGRPKVYEADRQADRGVHLAVERVRRRRRRCKKRGISIRIRIPYPGPSARSWFVLGYFFNKKEETFKVFTSASYRTCKSSTRRFQYSSGHCAGFTGLVGGWDEPISVHYTCRFKFAIWLTLNIVVKKGWVESRNPRHCGYYAQRE
jgi:hypothetical protein